MSAPTAQSAGRPDGVIRSLIPARIDRLTWSRFHTRLVVALGVAWVLDGLEITIAGDVAAILHKTTGAGGLGMSSWQVGFIATIYLLGEVFGALFFGRLSDKLGRRNLFVVTLGVYLLGNALTALTWSGAGIGLVYLYATRFIAGTGIGGEYAAINSAIDEMIPARYRGRVDIAVNGTYWGGSILGTLGELVLLNRLPSEVAWRIGFLIGPAIGLAIWNLRRHLPESPRWQIMHGREDEAEQSIAQMEHEVETSGGELEKLDESKAIEIKPSADIGFVALGRVLFTQMPKRAVLGATLMITQSFLYNAIFFTYTLVLTTFYGISSSSAPWFLIAFAVGNLAGPLLIGHLFDTIGRRRMISGTYVLSGILLFITAWLFDTGVLDAYTQTAAWAVIFFFASAGASSAYLTVSEIFPLEVRAKAIALFFAIAQAFGSFGPTFYGHLIGNGKDPGKLFLGYGIGATFMVIGGLVAWFLAVDAEGKSLEDVATPLSAVRERTRDAGHGVGGRRAADATG